MRRELWVVGVLVGCAVAERIPEDGGADLPELPLAGAIAPPTDPPAGGTGGVGGAGGVDGMGGVGGGLPQDMMIPPDMPVGGQPPGECTPGQRLGVCSVCGNDGMPSNPGLDDQCPVDCAGFSYGIEAGEDGSTLCILTERARAAEMVVCTGIGQCEDDPETLCTPPNTQQFAEAGPCQVMMGCVGEEPPQVMLAEDGTPCGEGDAGLCQNGTCEIDDPCEINSPYAREFCGSGQDGANTWCEWYVDGPGNNDYSCNQFCNDVGMFCLAVWNNVREGCGHGDNWNCNERADDQICRCTP